MFDTIKKLFGFKKEEKKEEITVDKESIKDAEMYYEEHQYAIKQRVNKLIETVKDRLADNGIELTHMDFRVSSSSMLRIDYPLEAIFMLEAMLIEIDINIDELKKTVKEDNVFFVRFPIFQCDIESYKNYGGYLEARLMTEEEIMQHKMLKKMGIQQ